MPYFFFTLQSILYSGKALRLSSNNWSHVKWLEIVRERYEVFFCLFELL